MLQHTRNGSDCRRRVSQNDLENVDVSSTSKQPANHPRECALISISSSCWHQSDCIIGTDSFDKAIHALVELAVGNVYLGPIGDQAFEEEEEEIQQGPSEFAEVESMLQLSIYDLFEQLTNLKDAGGSPLFERCMDDRRTRATGKALTTFFPLLSQ